MPDIVNRVVIVGSGNVAWHLQRALTVSCYVSVVNPRTLEGLPSKADIYILCVSDDAVSSVAQRIAPLTDGAVCHTSGSVSIDVLSDYEEYGVFYPMQTFSKGIDLDYNTITMFIEASDKSLYERLRQLANTFTDKVIDADSDARRRIHIGAVFACNFTNYLMGLADKQARLAGTDLKTLLPLVRQTIEKLDTMSPHDAQTGPASRGDINIINHHLDMLADDQAANDVYKLLSENILSLFR